MVLSPFEVSADTDTGYLATNSISGTKVATPLRELPITLQVITEDFIKDLGATELSEIIGYAATVESPLSQVNDGSTAGNATFTATDLRGIRNAYQLQDGFRRYSQPNAASLSRVEVVKGPSSVLYGYTQPGGIIKSVTKRRLPRRRTAIGQSASTENLFRTTIDHNQPMGPKLGLRFNGAYQDRESWRDYADNRQIVGSLVGTFRPRPGTSLTLMADFTEAEIQVPIGIPAVGNDHLNVNLRGNVPLHELYGVPLSFNPRGPDDGQVNRTTILAAFLDQKVGQDLNFRISLFNQARTSHQDRADGSVQFENGQAATQRYVWRHTWRHTDNQNRMFNATVDLLYRFEFAGSKNQILAGYQYYDDGFKETVYRDQAPTKTTPDYVPHPRLAGLLQPNFANVQRNTFELAPNFDASGVLRRPADVNLVYRPHESRFDKSELNAMYFTLQTKWYDDKLIGFGGVYSSRFDRFNRWRQVVAGRPNVRQNPSDTSPQAGIMYNPLPWLGVYALYSESLFGTTQGSGQSASGLQSNGNANSFGMPFGPEYGRSGEAGFKVDFREQKITGTVAAFRINQRNKVEFDNRAPNILTEQLENDGVVPNENQYGDDVQVDEITSEGIDADLLFRPFAGLQIVAGYAYVHRTVTDSTVLRANLEALNAERIARGQAPFELNNNWVPGRRVPGSILNRATLWGSYRFARGGRLEGLTLGGGLRWFDKRLVQYRTVPSAQSPNPNPSNTPVFNDAFWSADLFARYRTNVFGRATTLGVNVRNLLEDKIAVGFKPLSNERYYYATPREVVFSVNFDL